MAGQPGLEFVFSQRLCHRPVGHWICGLRGLPAVIATDVEISMMRATRFVVRFIKEQEPLPASKAYNDVAGIEPAESG
ncbi:MAG: hypothetical protein R3B47_00855 [Bacteroidia bacterium]